MSSPLRKLARKFLPDPIRKPLGSVFGKFQEQVIFPLQGLWFDLSGGRFQADGCEYVIPKDITRRAFRACFLGDTYEVDERKLVRKYIRPDDRVLELGACLGIVSCITNRLLSDRNAHLAVEANPRCLPALQQNRDLNRCSFAIENCAVSNQPEVTFYIHPTFIVGSTAQANSGVPVRVPGKSLRQLHEAHGPFSVLIMDIEGSELEILSASTDLLPKFRLIIVEMHEWTIGVEGVRRCREILQKAGFQAAERSHITEAWIRS